MAFFEEKSVARNPQSIAIRGRSAHSIMEVAEDKLVTAIDDFEKQRAAAAAHIGWLEYLQLG